MSAIEDISLEESCECEYVTPVGATMMEDIEKEMSCRRRLPAAALVFWSSGLST